MEAMRGFSRIVAELIYVLKRSPGLLCGKGTSMSQGVALGGTAAVYPKETWLALEGPQLTDWTWD